MAGRGLDSAARVLRGPTIDRERRRSCVPDDHQEPPHRGRTHRTADPARCSDVPSSLASDTKCRQKTESLFAKAFKSLLQQNRPDCVAKLFAALREGNNRIRLNDVLNQCCALAFVLKSILLILIVKIVLQHNPTEADIARCRVQACR